MKSWTPLNHSKWVSQASIGTLRLPKILIFTQFAHFLWIFSSPAIFFHGYSFKWMLTISHQQLDPLKGRNAWRGTSTFYYFISLNIKSVGCVSPWASYFLAYRVRIFCSHWLEARIFFGQISGPEMLFNHPPPPPEDILPPTLCHNLW